MEMIKKLLIFLKNWENASAAIPLSVAFSLTGKGYEVVSPDKTQVQEMNEDQSLDLGALLVPIDTGVPKLTTMPIDLV